MSLFHTGGIQSLPENISKQKVKERRRAEKRFQHSLQAKKSCRYFQNGVFQFDQFSSNLAQQMEFACNGNMEKLQAFSQKNFADLSSNLPCYMLSNNFRQEFGHEFIVTEDVIHDGCPPPKKAKLSISKNLNLYPNAELIGSHLSTSEKLLQYVGDLSEPSELTVCDFNPEFRIREENSRINSEKLKSILAHKIPFRDSPNDDLSKILNTSRDFAEEPESIAKVNQLEMKEAYDTSNTRSINPTQGGKAISARRLAGALNCGSNESLEINYSDMSSTDNSRSEISIEAVRRKSEAQMTVLLSPACVLGKRSSSSQSFLDFNETEAENLTPQRGAAIACQETVSNDCLNCETSASVEFATTSNYSKMESPSVPPTMSNIGTKTPYAVPEENGSTENVYASQLPEECAIGFDPYAWKKYGIRSNSPEGGNGSFSSAFMHTIPGERPPDDASKAFRCPSPQALFYSFADTVQKDVCDVIMSLDNGHRNASDLSEEFVPRQIKEPKSGPLIYEVFDDNLSINTEVRQGNPKMHIAEINGAKHSSLKYKQDCANNNQDAGSACDVVVENRVELHSFESSSKTSAIPEFKKPLRKPKRPKKRMREKNFDGRSSRTSSYKTYTSYYPSALIDTVEWDRHSHSRSKTKGKKWKRFKNPHTQNKKRNSKDIPKIPPLKIVNCDYKHRKRKSESKISLWKRLKRLFFCCKHKKRDNNKSTQQENYGSQYKPHISLFERIVIWWRRKTRRQIVVRKTSLELFRMQRQKILKEMQEFCEDCKIVSKNVRSLDINDRLNGRSAISASRVTQAKVVSSEGCLVIESQNRGLDVYLNEEKNIYNFHRKKPVKGILKRGENNQFSLDNDVNNNQIYAGRYNY